MDSVYPTKGQLERTLSQRILAFYRQHLGHQPSKVACQIFDNKLVIIIEDSITTAEKVLVSEGQAELVKEVRSKLEAATNPLLRELIEEIVQVEVTDLLSDATLETRRTGIVAVLAVPPKVRSTDRVRAKAKRQPCQDAVSN